MVKEERLRKNAQFAAVYEKGKTWASNLIVLKAMPNGLGGNRYGFVTGKRLGKAVVRNRVKRLLREAVRLTSTRAGWDVVFIARKGAATADYHQLELVIAGLLRRAQILADGDKGAGRKEA